jgi:hypothetical protein
MKRGLVVLLIFVAVGALADEIYLKGGGRISGILVKRSASSVSIETGPGVITFPMSRVERIVEGSSPLAEYRQRAARLASDDATGWLSLAGWARDSGLTTQAAECYERVVRLEPANESAHRALGHVPIGGNWGTLEESNRARGLVSFEGRWMSLDERRLLLEERANEAAERRAATESAARAKEAEARARLAEAEAKRAEADRAATDSQGYGSGWGSTWPIWSAPGTGNGQRHRPNPGPTPVPLPLPCARPQDCPAPSPVAQPQPPPQPQPRTPPASTTRKQSGSTAGVKTPTP